MKKVFFTLVLFISIVGHAQKIENIIFQGDLEKLKKIESKDIEAIHEYLSVSFFDDYEEEWFWVDMHPMTYAAVLEHEDIVRYYIEKKESFGGDDWFRDVVSQAFIAAISTGNQSLADLLYTYSPDLNAQCESCHQHSALMVAAAYGDEKWYFELKARSALSTISEDGNGLLHLASNHKSEKIFFDVLTERKQDVNKKNNFGLTPLDFAAINGNVKFFMELVNAGADITIAVNIWHSIAQGGSIELLDFAVKNANRDDIVLTDEYYDTPLHTAMMFNHTEMTVKIVDLTIQFYRETKYDRINSDAYSMNDVHPLYWAIDENNKETFEAYLKFASHIYLATDNPYIVPIYDNLYKSAKKTFGKAFVEELYATYEIVEL